MGAYKQIIFEAATAARRVRPAVAALLAVALVGGGQAAASDTAVGNGTIPSVLRVGISTDYPPVAFEKDGQLAGIEADFADRLGKQLTVKVEKVKVSWDDLIPALVEKRIDVIMSGMSITAERGKLVEFTEPYLRVGQMAVVRARDLARFRDYDAMEEPGARVGFQNNTTGESYARKSLARAKLTGYDSVEAGIAALRAEEIDFFIHDAPTIWRLTGHFDSSNDDLAGRYRPLTTEYLAWAVRRGEVALRDALNATLAGWEKNGEVDTVLDRWIRVRKVTVEVAPPR